MKRALVLGATGHIGAHVVRALLARGYDVRATYHHPTYLFVLEGLPIERVAVDLWDPSSLRRALEGCQLVFHCAGYYPRFTERRSRAMARGIAQTQQVCETLREARLERIVYTSSTATIAQAPGRLATEADGEPWPLTVWKPLYATVKIAMEHEVRRYASQGLPVVIVNPSVCVGEYDAHPFSGRLVLLFAKRRLPCIIEHRFNATYTGDVGVGHVLAAERGRVGERYLLAAHNVSLSEWALMIAEAAGVRPVRRQLPRAIAMAVAGLTEVAAAVTRTEPLLPRRAVGMAQFGQRLDGSKAQREFGWAPTPLDEAIRRAVAWFRQHHYLSTKH